MTVYSKDENLISLITFIVPPALSTFDNEFYIGRKGCPPLNIAYLASIAEGIEVDYKVIDALASDELHKFRENNKYRLLGKSIDQIVAEVDPATDLIAITSMFTSEWLVVRELASQLKKKYPEIKIVIGGEHATSDGHNLIKFEKNIDICFVGESEISFEILLKTGFVNLNSVPGIIYTDSDGNVIETPPVKRMLYLDDLYPSWKKIDLNYYLDRKLSYSQLGKRSMPIITSRGCPYSCTFCSNKKMWGNRYVTHSSDYIIAQMRHYIEIYKIEHFDFIDLATSINKKWFKELLNRIINELPQISWEMTVGTRSEVFDDEILDLLFRSGSHVLTFAPETGSPTMARKIKKRIDHKHMSRSIKYAVKRGFIVKTNVIVGFPNETVKELFETIFMCLKFGYMGVRSVTVMTYMPFLGTELSNDYNLYNEKTFDQYDARVRQMSGLEGAETFNIFKVFKQPKKQALVFIGNSLIVIAYILSCLRRPSYFIESIVNLYRGTPIGAVEVALHSIKTKLFN